MPFNIDVNTNRHRGPSFVSMTAWSMSSVLLAESEDDAVALRTTAQKIKDAIIKFFCGTETHEKAIRQLFNLVKSVDTDTLQDNILRLGSMVHPDQREAFRQAFQLKMYKDQGVPYVDISLSGSHIATKQLDGIMDFDDDLFEKVFTEQGTAYQYHLKKVLDSGQIAARKILKDHEVEVMAALRDPDGLTSIGALAKKHSEGLERERGKLKEDGQSEIIGEIVQDTSRVSGNLPSTTADDKFSREAIKIHRAHLKQIDSTYVAGENDGVLTVEEFSRVDSVFAEIVSVQNEQFRFSRADYEQLRGDATTYETLGDNEKAELDRCLETSGDTAISSPSEFLRAKLRESLAKQARKEKFVTLDIKDKAILYATNQLNRNLLVGGLIAIGHNLSFMSKKFVSTTWKIIPSDKPNELKIAASSCTYLYQYNESLAEDYQYKEETPIAHDELLAEFTFKISEDRSKIEDTAIKYIDYRIVGPDERNTRVVSNVLATRVDPWIDQQIEDYDASFPLLDVDGYVEL